MKGRTDRIKNRTRTIHHNGAIMHITAVTKRTDLSPKIRKFDEAMMRWYHRRGMHTTLSVEGLIKQFPTFLISVGSFTLSIQSGGGKISKRILADGV